MCPHATALRSLFLSIACACALASACVGCSDFGYLVQAAYGQRDIALRTRALDDALDDPKTPPRIKRLLGEVGSIKKFGERHGLTATKNYESYADLERPAAVWVVGACEPLRFKSKRWTFPVVGSVPYLGWFKKSDAERLARELEAQGWDVDVREAAAYSTLGWFRDPVLSTMIADGDEALGELADTVLHESLHATIYVNAQTHFNESLANFVGDELADDYLAESLGPDAPERRAFVLAGRHAAARVAVLQATYARLEELYTSKLPDAEKWAQKEAILAQVRRGLGTRRRITNATLADFKAYHTGRKELEDLFDTCGRDWSRFLRALKTVDGGSFSEPQQKDWSPVVRKLVATGCP
jgi:predicted aminopeptidase